MLLLSSALSRAMAFTRYFSSRKRLSMMVSISLLISINTIPVIRAISIASCRPQGSMSSVSQLPSVVSPRSKSMRCSRSHPISVSLSWISILHTVWIRRKTGSGNISEFLSPSTRISQSLLPMHLRRLGSSSYQNMAMLDLRLSRRSRLIPPSRSRMSNLRVGSISWRHSHSSGTRLLMSISQIRRKRGIISSPAKGICLSRVSSSVCERLDMSGHFLSS